MLGFAGNLLSYTNQWDRYFLAMFNRALILLVVLFRILVPLAGHDGFELIAHLRKTNRDSLLMVVKS